MLPLANLNYLQVACFMCLATHGLLPTYLCDMFITNNYVHFHDTKLSNSLHIFGPTKNILRYTIRIFGPLLWNSLSADLRNISTVYLFKKYYKQHLLDKLYIFQLSICISWLLLYWLYMYIYICIYMCVHMHVYVYVCLCVCMCVHI